LLAPEKVLVNEVALRQGSARLPRTTALATNASIRAGFGGRLNFASANFLKQQVGNMAETQKNDANVAR
jgi:hypothetical protein